MWGKVCIKYSQKRARARRIDWETEILLGDILKPRVCLPFYGVLSPFSATNGIGQTRFVAGFTPLKNNIEY